MEESYDLEGVAQKGGVSLAQSLQGNGVLSLVAEGPEAGSDGPAQISLL